MVLIDSCQRLQGPDKQPLTTHGHTNIKITIGTLTMSVKAILADITQPLILGAHFLAETRAKISFIENTVIFYEDMIIPIKFMEYSEVKYNTKCKVIAAVSQLAIPPRSLVWIPVTFAPKPITDIVSVIQTDRPDEHQVLSAKSQLMRYINDTDDLLWINNMQTIGWYDTDTDNIIHKVIQVNHIKYSPPQPQNAKPIMDLNLSEEQELKRWKLLKQTIQQVPLQLTNEQIETLFDRLKPLQFVIALEDEPLGLHEDLGEVIKTTCNPIRHKPRPLTPAKQLILDGIIDEYQKRGILVESDESWASPISLVAKRNGKQRLVVR